LGPDYFDYANGYIAVTPFTALQSPDGSDISVNVYIKSDEMMFNQMTSERLPTVRPTTESEELTPTEAPCIDLNDSSASVDYACEEHFGEQPVSFRGLLKRFTGGEPRGSHAVSANTIGILSERALYPYPVPAYDGVTLVDRQQTLFSYLRYAYVGMRGGMKFRHYIIGPLEDHVNDKISVSLTRPAAITNEYEVAANNFEEITGTMQGTVSFIPHTNAGVEFEVPFYSNNLFAISFSDDPLPASCTLVDSVATRGYQVWYFTQLDAANTVYLHRSFAIGEDFSFLRFQGAPIYQYG